MKKILVFADIHMTADGVRVWGRDPLSRMRAALQQALSRHGDADAIILLGDLAHSGKAAEYARLAEALQRVSIPVIPMLGNSDRRKAFRGQFPSAPATEQGHVQHILDLPRHRVITLDTLDGPPYRKADHSGRLCHDRMAWLMRALADRGDRHAVVFAHHPPMKIGMPGHDAIRLNDGADMLELLADSSGAHLICGHVHRAASGISRGVPYALIGSATAEFALTLNGEDIDATDSSGRYGVVLLQKHGVAVHQEQVKIIP